MRRRALVLAAVWSAVTAALAIVPGCYGRNCDGSTAEYGLEPTQGRMIDENTWESSPVGGNWLFYPGARTYFFNVPALGDRTPQLILPYLSPVEDPNVFHADRAPSNFTLGGGNLAELSGVTKGRFNVRNATCADYWMRVVVILEPRPPSPGAPTAPDASTTPDAGVSDASNDAMTDAEAGP